MAWDERAFQMYIETSRRVRRCARLYPPELRPRAGLSLAETLWPGPEGEEGSPSFSAKPDSSSPQVIVSLPGADYIGPSTAQGSSSVDVGAAVIPGAPDAPQTTSSSTVSSTPDTSVSSSNTPVTSSLAPTSAIASTSASPLPVDVLAALNEHFDPATLAACLDGIVAELRQLAGAAFLTQVYQHHFLTARDPATRKAAREGIECTVATIQRLIAFPFINFAVLGLAEHVLATPGAGENATTGAAAPVEEQVPDGTIPSTTANNANVGSD